MTVIEEHAELLDIIRSTIREEIHPHAMSIEVHATQHEFIAAFIAERKDKAAVVALDAAITETLTVDASDTPVSVAAADVRAATHILITNDGSPAATGAHTVVLPAVKRLLMIPNASGYAASIVCTADPDSPDNEVAIPNGEGRMVYCNAVRVYGAT